MFQIKNPFHIIVLLLSIIAVYYFAEEKIKQYYEEFLLLNDGVETEAYTEYTSDFTDDRGGVTYYYEYVFRDANNKKIRGYTDSYKSLPATIQVTYLKSNSNINLRTTKMVDSIQEFFMRRVLIGSILYAMFTSLVYIVGISSINNFIPKNSKYHVRQ